MKILEKIIPLNWDQKLKKCEEQKFRKSFNYNHQFQIKLERIIKKYIILGQGDFKYFRKIKIKPCQWHSQLPHPYLVFFKMKKEVDSKNPNETIAMKKYITITLRKY